MARTRTLIDAEGREYPASILDPAIVKRDRIVQKVMKRAQRLHTSITTDRAASRSISPVRWAGKSTTSILVGSQPHLS